MKKRSEVKRLRMIEGGKGKLERPSSEPVEPGHGKNAAVDEKGRPLFCETCLLPQWTTGEEVPQITCNNGHGGAAGLTSDQMRERQRKAAEETAAKLAKELDTSTAFVPRSAHRRDAEHPIRADFARITETVFVRDLHEEWERVKTSLQVGEKRSDHGTINRALDKAELKAHTAHRLYLTAKNALDEWEADNAATFGAMLEEANAQLQHEKDRGQRNKAITDGDARARAAVNHPEEWAAQEKRRARYKATVSSLENLADLAKSRCFSLRSMLEKLRG